VTAMVDIPSSTDKEMSSIDFEVVHIGDYSNQPAIMAPRVDSVEITSAGCFKSLSGPIQANITIACSVFAPGSTIPIKIQITNSSDRDVEKIVLKLKQTVVLTR
jgi:hypothetical protein